MNAYQLYWQELREIYKTWSVLKTMGNTRQIYALFVYNQGVKELIAHYRDSIDNREYHNFYYRDIIIFTIVQPSFGVWDFGQI